MAILRDHPYEGSNFLVNLGVFDPEDIRSTFCRVELPDAIVDEVAYRSGNEKTQDARKQPGLANYGHLVLKRGLIGSTDLWEWWKQADRHGSSECPPILIIKRRRGGLFGFLPLEDLLRRLPYPSR